MIPGLSKFTTEYTESTENNNGEREEINKINQAIIGAVIEVHRNLGPGLLESAYQAALAYGLNQLGFRVGQQKSLPMLYKEIKLDAGYRIDFLVSDKAILEIKSSDKISPIHDAQILSYLRLSVCKVGLLIISMSSYLRTA